MKYLYWSDEVGVFCFQIFLGRFLKFRHFQNVFMTSSFLPNHEQKIVRISGGKRGNIFPHVQFHFLVRPSFPTCAVPVLIFELSVPIFPHVQFHPNMHCPILPHVQFQQEYELATLGSCTVETPFNKRQFHKN